MSKAPAHHTCLNCGHPFTGHYCNHCGEKVYEEHDKKVTHLFHEAFHFLTHFDNKFFRSLKMIFIRPGLVSKEFTAGKRKAWYSPFSMFLVAIFLYLLFPQLQGLNVPFYTHLSNSSALGIHFETQWATAKTSGGHLSLSDLADHFDHLSPKVAKVLLIILIPLTALVLALFFRKKKRYFFDHFILASEYLSFFVFFVFFLLPLVFKLVGLAVNVGGVGDNNLLFVVLQLLGCWWVATAAMKRFYGVRTWKAILPGMLFLLMFLLIVFYLYRFLIFVVVMLMI